MLFQTSTILFNFIFDKLKFVKWWQNFLALNPKGPFLQKFRKRKEKFCVVLTYFIKWVHEIRKFHITAMQQRQRNVQKKMMQSCRVVVLLVLNPLLFSSSLYGHQPRWLRSLLLWSRNFVTMITCHHTSPLYSICNYYSLSLQRAKKVVSDSPGLVEFAMGQVNLVSTCPMGKWSFLKNSNYRRTVKSILLIKALLGLVQMTFGLVNATFSLPKWQVVKLTFFAPCIVTASTHLHVIRRQFI